MVLSAGALVLACGGAAPSTAPVRIEVAASAPNSPTTSGSLGASAAPSSVDTTPSVSAGRLLAITSLTAGGIGPIVKTADGRELTVLHPSHWPSAVYESSSGPNPKTVPHDFAAPIVAQLLASLRAVRPSPAVDAPSLPLAIHWLDVGAVVMAPDWTDTVFTKIERLGPKHFEVSFTKHGVALHATVARTPAYRGYSNDYGHVSIADLENHMFHDELVEPFRRAQLAPGVSPRLRDELVTLLAKPAATTLTPTEP
jgi:hypothetical protein